MRTKKIFRKHYYQMFDHFPRNVQCSDQIGILVQHIKDGSKSKVRTAQFFHVTTQRKSWLIRSILSQFLFLSHDIKCACGQHVWRRERGQVDSLSIGLQHRSKLKPRLSFRWTENKIRYYTGNSSQIQKSTGHATMDNIKCAYEYSRSSLFGLIEEEIVVYGWIPSMKGRIDEDVGNVTGRSEVGRHGELCKYHTGFTSFTVMEKAWFNWERRRIQPENGKCINNSVLLEQEPTITPTQRCIQNSLSFDSVDVENRHFVQREIIEDNGGSALLCKLLFSIFYPELNRSIHMIYSQ